MKKIFNEEYPDENIREISKWIQEKMVDKDGNLKIFRPTIIVEIIEEN